MVGRWHFPFWVGHSFLFKFGGGIFRYVSPTKSSAPTNQLSAKSPFSQAAIAAVTLCAGAACKPSQSPEPCCKVPNDTWNPPKIWGDFKHLKLKTPIQMAVSENRGYPQIIHFNRVFHYKSSILGYPYFWKHPNEHLSQVQSKHTQLKFQCSSFAVIPRLLGIFFMLDSTTPTAWRGDTALVKKKRKPAFTGVT